MFNLQCQAARLRRKIQLIQKAINHNKDINTALIERQLDIEYEEWQLKITKMFANIAISKARLKSLMSQEESKQLQSLYRELVKTLHPDVNENQVEKYKLLWNQTQQAYLNGDIEELKTIKLLLDNISNDSDDNFQVNGTIHPSLSTDATYKTLIEKLDKNIQLVKEKIFNIMEYIKKIKNEFPFTIENKIEDEKWVNKKNSEIFEKQEIIKSQIKDLKNIIDSIILDNINKISSLDGDGYLENK